MRGLNEGVGILLAGVLGKGIPGRGNSTSKDTEAWGRKKKKKARRDWGMRNCGSQNPLGKSHAW